MSTDLGDIGQLRYADLDRQLQEAQRFYGEYNKRLYAEYESLVRRQTAILTQISNPEYASTFASGEASETEIEAVLLDMHEHVVDWCVLNELHANVLKQFHHIVGKWWKQGIKKHVSNPHLVLKLETQLQEAKRQEAKCRKAAESARSLTASAKADFFKQYAKVLQLKDAKVRNQWSKVRHGVSALADDPDSDRPAHDLFELEGELRSLQFHSLFDWADTVEMRKQEKALKSARGKWSKYSMRQEVRKRLKQFQGPTKAEVILKAILEKAALGAAALILAGLEAIGQGLLSGGILGVTVGAQGASFSMGVLGGV